MCLSLDVRGEPCRTQDSRPAGVQERLAALPGTNGNAGPTPAPGTMDGNNGNIKNGQSPAVIDELVADVITGRPHDFTVGCTTYYLWPMTLAKSMLLQPYIERLGLGTAKVHGSDGVLRMITDQVRERRAECAIVLSILTMENTRAAFYDYVSRKQRSDFFGLELADGDLAQLLASALMCSYVQRLSEHFGMNRERERLAAALRTKEKTRNSLTFCGVSVFGSFVAPLLEMGFSFEEIVFERSYELLHLMLMDKPVSLWLSDDELAGAGGSVGALIDGDSGDADQQLMAYFSSKGVSVIDAGVGSAETNKEKKV